MVVLVAVTGATCALWNSRINVIDHVRLEFVAHDCNVRSSLARVSGFWTLMQKNQEMVAEIRRPEIYFASSAGISLQVGLSYRTEIWIRTVEPELLQLYGSCRSLASRLSLLFVVRYCLTTFQRLELVICIPRQ